MREDIKDLLRRADDLLKSRKCEEALVAATMAAEAAQQANEHGGLSDALSIRADVYGVLGRFEEALLDAEAAVKAGQEGGSRVAEGRAWQTVSEALRVLGRIPESVAASIRGKTLYAAWEAHADRPMSEADWEAARLAAYEAIIDSAAPRAPKLPVLSVRQRGVRGFLGRLLGRRAEGPAQEATPRIDPLSIARLTLYADDAPSAGDDSAMEVFGLLNPRAARRISSAPNDIAISVTLEVLGLHGDALFDRAARLAARMMDGTHESCWLVVQPGTAQLQERGHEVVLASWFRSLEPGRRMVLLRAGASLDEFLVESELHQ